MTQTQSEFNNNSTSSPLYVRSSSQSQETSTNKILLTPSPIKSGRSEIFGTTTPLTVPDTQININDIPQTIQESQFIEETQNEINTKKRLRSGKDIEINRKKRNIEIYKAPDNDDDDDVYSMNEISSTQKKLNILKNKNDNKVIDPFASIPQKRKTDDEDTSFSSENFVYPKPKLIKYNKNNNKKINDIIVDVVEEKEEEKKVEEKKTEIVKNKEIIKNNRIYKKNKSDMIEQDSPDNIIIIPMLKLSVESQGKKFQKVFHKQKQTKINLI